MSLTPKIITGMPAGKKPRPRADFKPDEFDQAITTKGYRMWWSRAGICPCVNNAQTEQPDVTCGLCRGEGYYYFLPDAAVLGGSREDSEGNVVKVNDTGNAILIRVLMTSLTVDPQIFEKFGEWAFGASRATVQPGNRLGYRDRLISADSEMPWAQIIEYDGSAEISITGGYSKAGLRYPYLSVNHFRSLATLYRQNEDFELTANGKIRWLGAAAPAAGTRLSIHGTVRPTWLVMDHLHVIRDTQLEGPDVAVESQTFQTLPVQAVVKLDFLIKD
jgi:hypothetical protein